MTEIRLDIDDRDFKDKMNRFASQVTKTLTGAMMLAFQAVGLKSTQEYMTRSHVISGGTGYNIGTAGSSKLNIRSGRLARSLIGGFDFSGGSGGQDESIREIQITGNTITGTYGSSVPYANIHEKGGTITGNPYLIFRIGPFWYKKRSVTIPARPFLEPALEDSETNIHGIFQSAMEALAFKVSDK